MSLQRPRLHDSPPVVALILSHLRPPASSSLSLLHTSCCRVWCVLVLGRTHPVHFSIRDFLCSQLPRASWHHRIPQRGHVDGGGVPVLRRLPRIGRQGDGRGGAAGQEDDERRVLHRGGGGGGGADGELVDRRAVAVQLLHRRGLLVGGWQGGGGGGGGEQAQGGARARVPGGPGGFFADQERALQLLRRQVQVVHEPGGGCGAGGREGARQAGEPVQQAPPDPGNLVAPRLLQLTGHGHLPAPAPRARPRPPRGGRRRGGRLRRLRLRRTITARPPRQEQREGGARIAAPDAERAHPDERRGGEEERELQVSEVLLAVRSSKRRSWWC